MDMESMLSINVSNIKLLQILYSSILAILLHRRKMINGILLFS